MAGAVIAIDQDRPGPSVSSGSPGVARNDLWQSRLIHLRDAAGSNNSWQWTLLYVPTGSAAALSGDTTATASFTPDLPGSYRVQLVTNGGGPGNIQIRVARVRYDNSGTLTHRGWALPAFGEQDGESNYSSNLIAWAETFEYIVTDLLTNFGPGGVSGQAITPASVSTTGDVTVGGHLIQGPNTEVVDTTTTTGAASAPLLALPLVANAVALLDFRIIGFCNGVGSYTNASTPGAGFFSGGSPASFGPLPTQSFQLGLPPKTTGSYAAGVLTIVVTGPTVNVTNAVDNGGGKVRLSVSPGNIDVSLTGQSITVSGVVGTTEANGANIATYVSSNTLDLLGVSFVNPYTSGGVIVYTTPPVVHWAGWARVVAVT